MSDEEGLNRRLRAVERSLTDGDHDVDALREAGATADRIEDIESRLGDVEDRVAELEATTQALRGYVGNVRSVNEDVEQRANAALGAVERLEDRLAGTAHPPFDDQRPPERRPATAGTQAEASTREDPDTGSQADETEADESLLERVRDAL